MPVDHGRGALLGLGMVVGVIALIVVTLFFLSWVFGAL